MLRGGLGSFSKSLDFYVDRARKKVSRSAWIRSGFAHQT